MLSAATAVIVNDVQNVNIIFVNYNIRNDFFFAN